MSFKNCIRKRRKNNISRSPVAAILNFTTSWIWGKYKYVSNHQSNVTAIQKYYISRLKPVSLKKIEKKNISKSPMAAILNFTIYGKTVSLTAWHTAEMDSAHKSHLETPNEVLFLKNAYGFLSRGIFQFLVLTTQPDVYIAAK